MAAPRAGVLVSLSANPTLEFLDGRYGDHQVAVLRRSGDWGLRGHRKLARIIREATALRRAARGREAVIVATAGWELPVFLLLLLFGRGRPPVLAYDYLFPAARRLDAVLGAVFRRTGLLFGCVRSGDLRTLATRFGIGPQRLAFHRFPGPQVPPAKGAGAGPGFIYAAGLSHRDWPTTAAVLAAARAPSVVSTTRPDCFAGAPERVQVVPPLGPADGQRLLETCTVCLQLFEPTDLPSGPLLLLDAMARGVSVVATECNATRDYLEHEVSGLLVPPRDVAATVAAVERLFTDPDLRARVAAGGRTAARSQSPHDLLAELICAATKGTA